MKANKVPWSAGNRWPQNTTFSKVYDVHKRFLKGKRADILGEIEALSRKRGYCYAKVSYFVEKLGICKKTVMNYYRDLEKLRMIRRLKRGRRTYIVLDIGFYLPMGDDKQTLDFYTNEGVNFTPMSFISVTDPYRLFGDFLEEEKKKEKGQTNAPLFYFGNQRYTEQGVREKFQEVLVQQGFSLSWEQIQPQIEKFLSYHRGIRASRYGLLENILSWVQKDLEGPFYHARLRKIQRQKEREQEQKEREQQREKERRQEKEREEALFYAPVIDDFFHLFHKKENIGMSLSQILEKAESRQKGRLRVPPSIGE